MEALRFNQGKPQVHYILFYKHFIEALAKVQEHGAIKYGYANWAAGGKPDTEYLDAGMRHLLAFFEGEMYDKDLGVMHLAQVCWNFMNLIEQNYSDWPTLDPDFDFDEFVARWADMPKQGTSLNVMERVAELSDEIQSDQPAGGVEG